MKKVYGAFLCIIVGLVLFLTVIPTAVHASGVDINETNFPNAQFRRYVSRFDLNEDGYLDNEELSVVLIIDIIHDDESPDTLINRERSEPLWNDDGEPITLKGIEFFFNLRELCCSCMELTELDVSKNTALRHLECDDNRLTSLELNNNTALEYLDCSYNNMKTIDTSKNMKLEYFLCMGNQIKTLDVSKNSSLYYFNFGNNLVSSINVSNNKSLALLSCYNNLIQSLDLLQNTNLDCLDCSGNKLSILNISQNPLLNNLSCYGNNIASIDLRNTPKLNNAVVEGEKVSYEDYDLYRKNGVFLYVDKTTSFITYSGSDLEPTPAEAGQRKFKTFSDIFLNDKTGEYTKKLEYTIDYNEQWFYSSPFEHTYNKAIFSLALTMASISDNSHTNSENILQMYKDLGFKEAYIQINYPEPEDDSVGSTIGLKNIKNDSGEVISLLAVTIRSGGYGKEWGGNFEVGYDTNHQGFNKAANEVIARIKSFIKCHPASFTKNTVVWVTGFSRGAAIANLVASKLDDGVINDALSSIDVYPVTNETVFAYCFECPQNTVSANAKKSKYNNICNITIPIDMVPKVPSDVWSFRRYGKDYYVNTPETHSDYYKTRKPGMLNYYGKILNANGLSPNGKKYAENLTIERKGQNEKLYRLIAYISTLAGGHKSYSQFHQDQIMNIVRKYLGKDDSKDVSMDVIIELVGVFGGPTVFFDAISGTFFGTRALLKELSDGLYLFTGDPVTIGASHPVPMRAHYPELALSWLLYLRDREGVFPSSANEILAASDEEILLSDLDETTTRYLYISAEADASVYDKDDNLVAQIIGNEVSDIEEGIYCYINSDGQKVFILPNDMEYRVDVKPTEDGKMTYTCVETDLADHLEYKLVSYQELDVTEDQKIVGTIDDISNNESSGEYRVLLDNTELVPTVFQTDDEIVQYEVKVNTEGFGTVSGGGLYHGGDYAVVKVITQESHFLGWYVDGACVSNDTEYQFTVEGGTAVTAVFDELTTERITEVQDDGISPTVGMSAGRQIRSLNTPSDKQYNVNIEAFTQWYCETDSLYMGETDVFESGKEYSLRILISANNGYAFAENENVSWQINNGTELVDAEVSYVAGSQQEAVLRTVPMPAVSNLPFTDTKPGKFYFDPVAWAYYHEPQITTGTDDTHFSPNNTCTRAQVVTFLWRANGCPEPETTKNPFTDVKSTAYYYKAVLWAVENNITTGLKDAAGNPTGKFDPKGACTRGQVVTFLYRASGSPSFETTECPFTDVKPKAFYYNATLWAVENDITTGMKDKDGNPTGLFAPNDSCTRGQVVTFLYRNR